ARGRRSSVRLKIDTDHLVLLGEQIDVWPEHLERAETAVEQDERFAFSDDLVAELDPVDAGKLRGFGCHLHIVSVMGNQPATYTCAATDGTSPLALDASMNSMYGPNGDLLAKKNQVIGVDLQSHG